VSAPSTFLVICFFLIIISIHIFPSVAAVQVFLLLGILFGEGKALFAEVENKKVIFYLFKKKKKKKKLKQSNQAAGYKKSHEHERVYVALFVLVALAAAAASTRVHPEINHPIRGAPTEKVVTGGIWAVHFGYDNEMWASNVRMANLIRDAELDFIGTCTPFFYKSMTF